MNIFQRFRASLQLREAIKKADNAWRLTGRRHYVLPTFGGSQRLIIMDRKNFRIFKQKHYIKPNATIRDVERECFYCTAYADGNNYLTDEQKAVKRQNFYNWCEAMRLCRKGKK